ncbi:hypothetical protein AGMMS49950_11540 [Endomicrobiia bacterium]|nr:hypothetical protein AGMMS49950_11540 [Endomicrobiia bacterium]
MTLKTLSTLFMTYTLFSMFLSSCDGNNALIVNRRTATPEKIKEYEKLKRRNDTTSTSASPSMATTLK